MHDLQLGFSIWPQYTTWEAQKEFGLLAESLGYDHIWTWDHFLPIVGDPTGPNFECWQILAAWGALTSRIRIGAMVCGNNYRHPAVLAKMAATLDHITHGRAILGIGAGWYEREYHQYGIAFGTAGERLAMLDEAAHVVRSLLDQRTSTFEGRYYRLDEAMAEPKPLQNRLPIMIGGGGEKKTLRITARYADMWNGFGTAETAAHKIAILRQHCADVGRNFDDITPTVMTGIIVRDDDSALADVKRRVAETNKIGEAPSAALTSLEGNVEHVAQGLAAYWKAGVRGIIVRMPAPYDRETAERLIAEVRPRLRELIESSAAHAPAHGA